MADTTQASGPAGTSQPPAPAPAEPHEHPHVHSARPYIIVWLALLAFTAITFLTGRLHLGTVALPLALFIATTKSLLVLLFFMHLWEQKGANRMVVGLSVSFVLLLLGLTLTDVATRFPPTTPRGAPFGSMPPGHAEPPSATVK